MEKSARFDFTTFAFCLFIFALTQGNRAKLGYIVETASEPDGLPQVIMPA